MSAGDALADVVLGVVASILDRTDTQPDDASFLAVLANGNDQDARAVAVDATVAYLDTLRAIHADATRARGSWQHDHLVLATSRRFETGGVVRRWRR